MLEVREGADRACGERTPVGDEPTWEETDEAVEVEVKRVLDKAIPVPLPSDRWEDLRREARELGVGPTSLARMWILEKLHQVLVARKLA